MRKAALKNSSEPPAVARVSDLMTSRTRCHRPWPLAGSRMHSGLYVSLRVYGHYTLRSHHVPALSPSSCLSPYPPSSPFHHPLRLLLSPSPSPIPSRTSRKKIQKKIRLLRAGRDRCSKLSHMGITSASCIHSYASGAEIPPVHAVLYPDAGGWRTTTF